VLIHSIKAGNEFQAAGPVCKNARSPNLVYRRGVR